MKALVCVKVFSSRTEAEIAKALLEAHNIKAIIEADDAGGMRPSPFQYVCGVEVVVSSKDFQKAQKILKNP